MARGHGDRSAAIKRLERLIKRLALPEVELSTSFGDPSFKLRDKALVTIKELDLLYLPCPMEQKELLLEMAPEIYYQTDHYKGWPGLLVRLDVIDDDELSLRLDEAWRYRAPKKLAAGRRAAGL